jgi:hypothetical protein
MYIIYVYDPRYVALRGAATLKARALKEVWNIAAVTPLEKGMGGITVCGKANNINNSTGDSGEIVNGDNLTGSGIQELLAKGSELLKRTRNGIIIVIINYNLSY